MKSSHFIVLFIFHAVISVFTYQYNLENPSDSTLYWLLNYDINRFEWLALFKVGTPFMVFLNYPLLKLDPPFWFGHVIYSIIGFFGIYLFAKWAFEVLSVKSGFIITVVLVAFILCSPNLNVWTSIIGKEAIIFWSLSALFYTSLHIRSRWYLGVVGLFLLVMIRPHVAFMLFSATIIVLLFDRSLSLKLRGSILGSFILVGSGLVFLMLKISNIRYLDWERIQHFNEFSVLSLKDTAGYVPMLDYTYFYKIFSLNFRPLFYDVYNAITFWASFENFISLLFIGLGMFLIIKHFKNIIFYRWIKVSFLFFIVASVLYIERYSNLGLFTRTKMMYMPFVSVAVTSIISQSLRYTSASTNLIRLTTVPLSLQYLIKGQPRFMSKCFEVLCVSSGPKAELEKVADYEGVEVQEVDMTRQITPLKDLLSLFKLIQLFRKEKPTIVHTHTPKAGILGMLAANLAGVPIRLHTLAGLPLMEAKGIKRQLLDAVEKMTYACATNVYPNSKGLEQFILKNNYAKAKKVKVIANGSSNGINIFHFDSAIVSNQEKKILRQQLGIQKNDFVFIFVGRLVGDKGINELVAAFKSLSLGEGFRERNSRLTAHDSRLLLVGPLESELDPLQSITFQEIESNPNIITTGFQEDVRPYFAIANALVFPSYREGFPNVVMQAGAMGLPSIVSDINGCNEIIEHAKNGLIIPAKDSEALQAAMKRLLEDGNLYQQLKKNAREMITSRYEQQLVWEALLEEYKRLLKERGIDPETRLLKKRI